MLRNEEIECVFIPSLGRNRTIDVTALISNARRKNLTYKNYYLCIFISFSSAAFIGKTNRTGIAIIIGFPLCHTAPIEN